MGSRAVRSYDLTEWEVQSMVQTGRAQTLETIAGDETVRLDAGDRAVLQRIAGKLRERARVIVQEGRV